MFVVSGSGPNLRSSCFPHRKGPHQGRYRRPYGSLTSLDREEEARRESLPGVNFKQMGGLILARESNEEGKVQMPSPQINPDATAGISNAASLALTLFQANTTTLPMTMSIAKLAPTRNGMAMAVGSGTNLPYWVGRTSLSTLVSTAKVKNPTDRDRQCLGSAEKPCTPRMAMLR
ncbi:hypothetical protein EJB05_06409, partial [Eragrostis curvula]